MNWPAIPPQPRLTPHRDTGHDLRSMATAAGRLAERNRELSGIIRRARRAESMEDVRRILNESEL